MDAKQNISTKRSKKLSKSIRNKKEQHLKNDDRRKPGEAGRLERGDLRSVGALGLAEQRGLSLSALEASVSSTPSPLPFSSPLLLSTDTNVREREKRRTGFPSPHRVCLEIAETSGKKKEKLNKKETNIRPERG